VTTFSVKSHSCEPKPFCCVDHGPSCENENHTVIGLEVWRSMQGLCGTCGEPGDVPWGDLTRLHVLRCRRCALTQQLEHARERAAAIPQLEAELKAVPPAGRVGVYEGQVAA